MIYFFILVSFSFVLMNILFLLRLRRNELPSPQAENKIPGVSIVVAAKNEQDNIARLLESIKNCKYPYENFEIIIVDDRSQDDTTEIINSLKGNHSNLKVVTAKDKPYPGKKGALALGIQYSKYDFILITDADCVVSEKWIETFANKFLSGFDFVFGAAPLTNNLDELNYFSEKNDNSRQRFLSRGLLRNDSLKSHIQDDCHFDQREKSHSFIESKSSNASQLTKQGNFISKISSFENLRSSILTFTAAKLGMPYSAAARSFGFKKSSFEKVKGYANTTETLSGDDDLLLREAVKAKMKIDCIIEPDAFVYSETKKTFREYLFQKSRHTKTSLHYLFKSQLVLGLWHIANLLLMLSLFLIPLNLIYITFFILKLLIDVIVVLSLQKKFGYSFNFFEIIFLQPVYEVMLVINFFAGIILPDKWK
ncbi:MAG: glycosyltransferase [Ignavibacteriales bacterium]|nr:MAG: glycosyltransferase [Ignavibacteriales bacterium]